MSHYALMMADPTEQIETTVLFFAKARELAGRKQSRITTPRILYAAELLHFITRDYHLESIRDQVILAVNEEFVELDKILVLQDTDIIAIIPPLSGGLLLSDNCFLN